MKSFKVFLPASSVNWHNTSNGLLNSTITGLAGRGLDLGNDFFVNNLFDDDFDERVATFLFGLVLKRVLNDGLFTGVAIVKARCLCVQLCDCSRLL